MATNGEKGQIDFVTLGMFIIDDIYPPPTAADQTPQTDVVGGAGTYSAIGARLFSPPPLSKSVGWIVDAGTDFPEELRSIITSWDTGVLLRPRNGPTTRGWNGYGAHEHRAFKYLTEKKRLTADDLNPDLLKARSFHLICNPTRCVDMVQQVLHRRRQAFGETEPTPLMIWEPVPDLCTAEELDNTLAALPFVDVISPNHEELGSLFSEQHASGVDKAVVERHAARLLARSIGPTGQGAVVVRCGAQGCYVLSPTTSSWLPAYHTNPSRVVDPTGGGNGFLGGLAIGLVRTGFDIIKAGRFGNVAASFCIEQVGVPRLTSHEQSRSSNGETWNGNDVMERLDEFTRRTAA